MDELKKKSGKAIDHVAIRATRWIGSTSSLVVHTLLFVISFLLYFWGFELDKILLVVTTIVSLEAIYLSIFIQMSVNRHSYHLQEVAEDVEEIQEDVEEIQEDVEEIQEEDESEEQKDIVTLSRIESTLEKLMSEISELKKENENKSKS